MLCWVFYPSSSNPGEGSQILSLCPFFTSVAATRATLPVSLTWSALPINWSPCSSPSHGPFSSHSLDSFEKCKSDCVTSVLKALQWLSVAEWDPLALAFKSNTIWSLLICLSPLAHPLCYSLSGLSVPGSYQADSSSGPVPQLFFLLGTLLISSLWFWSLVICVLSKMTSAWYDFPD